MHPAHFDDLDFMSASEAAAWCGLGLAQFLAGVEAGQIPAPIQCYPLRWRESDFLEWMAAKGQEND